MLSLESSHHRKEMVDECETAIITGASATFWMESGSTERRVRGTIDRLSPDSLRVLREHRKSHDDTCQSSRDSGEKLVHRRDSLVFEQKMTNVLHCIKNERGLYEVR